MPSTADSPLGRRLSSSKLQTRVPSRRVCILTSSEAFLLAMKAALDLGPDGRAAMGRRARAHIARNFRAAEQYGKLADVIERM